VCLNVETYTRRRYKCARARVCVCVCVCVCMYTARKAKDTRRNTGSAGQTQSRGSTRGQPSTSNSNQRRQTRCVNMTCLLRETWEVPLLRRYVAVRIAKEAFTTTTRLLGSPLCNSLLPLPESYCLGENKISVTTYTRQIAKLLIT